MIQFSGCLGSRKTSTAFDIAKIFSQKTDHTSIWINPASVDETKNAVNEAGCWGLTSGSKKLQTDVGVYMQAVKAINLSKILESRGENVLLVIDGIRNILQAEWHMTQLLSNKNKIGIGEFAFRSPQLPPISILN